MHSTRIVPLSQPIQVGIHDPSVSFSFCTFTDSPEMDPLSITLGVISLTTALKDIIEVGERIYNSFARVTDNLHHAQSLARDVHSTVYQLKNICEEHHEALKNDTGMRRALGDLLSEMHAFEMRTVSLIPVTGGGLKRRFKMRIAGWIHSKEIEARILELKNHVTKCHSKFTMFTMIRIEAKLESIQRTTTQGVQFMRSGVSTLALNLAQVSVTQGPMSNYYPPPSMLEPPNEDVNERAIARVYLSSQIKAITKWFINNDVASYLDSAGAQPTQAPILKDALSDLDAYSPVLQPVFGASWLSLHRHTLVLALQIRNMLEENEKQPPIPVVIQRVVLRLPSLSSLLQHLNMIEEAGAIVNWAITVYKTIQFASPSAISPRLIYCLYSLSTLCDAVGDKDGAYLAMDEALAVSKHLQANTWKLQVPIAVRVQYSEVMTGYANILARQRQDYTGAHIIAVSAVQIMEEILDVSPVDDPYHKVVDGYVQPTSSFLRRAGEMGEDSQQTIFVYAQALRVHAYLYRSENAAAGSLGDTLRAMVIFQYLHASHGSAALLQLADTLYDIISHPDRSCLSPKQLLVYADDSITIYHQRLEDNSARFSKCLLGVLQIRAELLHHLGRDNDMLQTWRDYVDVAQTALKGDSFANALMTVTTSLRKLNMFSDSVSIQTQSVHIFEIMNRASMHAQAKWNFSLSLDCLSAGRFAEATRAAGRSVAKYRDLERTNPGAWSASLARGLSVLALCLFLTEDHDGAQLNCAEAVEIFQCHPDQPRVEKMYRRTREIGALVSEREKSPQ